MIAQVYSLKRLYQYALVPANIFYDFLEGYAMVIFPERKATPFNGSLTGLTIFCITILPSEMAVQKMKLFKCVCYSNVSGII